MHLYSDLFYCSNNGTLAVMPAATGRLATFVRMVAGTKHERVWVFGDAESYERSDGTELVDHHRRGVMAGTWDQGQAFLNTCRELGLCVSSTGIFVPFSNGHSLHGTFRNGTPMSDYAVDELRLARWDALPTREDIARLIAITR